MHSKFYLFCAVMVVVAVVGSTPHAQAVDPAVKCEAGKLKGSGKYGFCRLKAEAKGVLKGLPVDLSKCETRFTGKFNKTEFKAGSGVCPSEGDESAINERITRHADDITTLLAGGTVADAGGLSATGQTTAFGPGSDGDVQAGAALAYMDNGDGTITDKHTGLVWEKKDVSGGIHSVGNLYTWSTGTDNMDGTIATTFLATLNAGSGFAGHADWRIPNIKELQSLVDYEVFGPSIDPAFHQAATCGGCTDVALPTCSCTVTLPYWSSTTLNFVGSSVDTAWVVDFSFGGVDSLTKTDGSHVRAVRGAL